MKLINTWSKIEVSRWIPILAWDVDEISITIRNNGPVISICLYMNWRLQPIGISDYRQGIKLEHTPKNTRKEMTINDVQWLGQVSGVCFADKKTFLPLTSCSFCHASSSFFPRKSF